MFRHRRTLPIIIALLGLLLCSGCNTAPEVEVELHDKPAAVAQEPVNPEVRHYWKELGEADRAVYLRIMEAAENMEPEIYIDGGNMDALVWLICQVNKDFPEYFWFQGVDSTMTTTVMSEPVECGVKLRYSMTPEEKDAAVAKVESAAQECLNGADPAATDYEKVRYVYDWVVEHVDYTQDAFDQSLYTALAEGKGVCAGYARATQYLLQQLGVECNYITGRAREIAHSWNVVKLDDNYYHLDPTWGDPVYQDSEEGGPISYAYFCVNDGKLKGNHEIQDLIGAPACSATDYDYFVYNGLELDSYDAEAVQAIVNQAVENRDAVRIRFPSDEALSTAREALVDNGAIFDMLQATGSDAVDTENVYHSEDEDQHILTLRLVYA